MIKSFRDTWLHNFFKEDTYKKKIPSSIRRILFRKLQILDDATCDSDLRSPPGNHFEKLSGSLQEKSCVRVNKQWRLIFTWDGERGEANGVYLDKGSHKNKLAILSVEAPDWQGAKVQEYQAYSELSQRSQAGCIGA